MRKMLNPAAELLIKLSLLCTLVLSVRYSAKQYALEKQYYM